MFRKHRGRRPTNIVFVIFRLCLSVVMFALLLAGVYSAYKHFSGFDPLKLDPTSIIPQQLQQLMTAVVGQSQKKIQQIIPADAPAKSIPGISQGEARYIFRFLLLADSHNDSDHLKKAIAQAKQTYPDVGFIIGLGDYTDVGTINELKIAKNELDLSSLRYFLLAGDHDLWDSRDKQTEPTTNFKTVFGLTYQSFTHANARFILLNNSDNYTGMSEEQLAWLETELEKAKSDQQSIYVFLHEPLYHPSSDHVMGRVEGRLKTQAKSLIHQLKTAGVKKVFAGDTHYFSEYEEPETKLPMVTIGAVTTDRNPQAPRFAVGYIFEDGTLKVEDVEIK